MAVLAGAVLVGVTACSPGGGAEGSSETTGPSSSEEVLASVDPCEVLSESELESFGLRGPGEPRSELPWKPGCYYEGSPINARLEKNTRQTVASSERKDVWAEFERVEVNGRPGARAITKGATQARTCNVMFDAGRGTILVRAMESSLPDDLDECAKALEIAETVEPKVPEPA
ncbi:DUF3558 domain-containing protein [Actinopolyspora mortivallis]|uniref:DUF3558 domain-containing protein n=1 Tax=Actinopolyspora mortivallis TaxID=33906 RepID=UPI0005278CB1|nr:DUF3558 domain-containing protein [Actinopolyspora mortivallis]